MNLSKKTWPVKILFAFASLLILDALFYAEEDLRGKLDWNSYQHQWEAKGQKFNYDDFVPAPVPDDENFAMSPVWVASIKYLEPRNQIPEEWYGDRLNNTDVSKFLEVMPVTPSALAGPDFSGQNWTAKLPATPQNWIEWTSGRTLNLQPWQSYYRALAKKNPSEISLSFEPQSPAADILQALSKYDPVIAQLRQDSQRPYSRFPVQYVTDDPAGIWLPHLAALKQWDEVLELRAIAELHDGQAAQAADDIKLSLRLVDSIQTEPFVITHLVRMVMLQMAIQPIYEGLAAHQWTDAQLAGFDSELARVNFAGDFQRSVQGECAMHVKEVQWLAQKPSRLSELFGEDDTYTTKYAELALYLVPKGWIYRADVLSAMRYQDWNAAITNNDDGQPIVSPAKTLQASHDRKAMSRRLGPLTYWELMMTPDLSSYVQRTAFAQEAADLARVAIALERYNLSLGTYPDSLNSLAPRFMQTIPPDVINGQPLRYLLTPDRQFVLYSVGWKEQDDGGKFTGNSGGIGNLDRGDWLWRYPKE